MGHSATVISITGHQLLVTTVQRSVGVHNQVCYYYSSISVFMVQHKILQSP